MGIGWELLRNVSKQALHMSEEDVMVSERI